MARLDGLRRKPSLRRRWVSLFADLWEEIREVWEAEGLAHVEDACRQVRRRLAEGVALSDLDVGLRCWLETPQREHEGHPSSGDRCRARPTVRLQNVAIDPDAALAERPEIGHRAQASADQPLDLVRSSTDAATGGFPLHPRVRRTR